MRRLDLYVAAIVGLGAGVLAGLLIGQFSSESLGEVTAERDRLREQVKAASVPAASPAAQAVPMTPPAAASAALGLWRDRVAAGGSLDRLVSRLDQAKLLDEFHRLSLWGTKYVAYVTVDLTPNSSRELWMEMNVELTPTDIAGPATIVYRPTPGADLRAALAHRDRLVMSVGECLGLSADELARLAVVVAGFPLAREGAASRAMVEFVGELPDGPRRRFAERLRYEEDPSAQTANNVTPTGGRPAVGFPLGPNRHVDVVFGAAKPVRFADGEPAAAWAAIALHDGRTTQFTERDEGDRYVSWPRLSEPEMQHYLKRIASAGQN